jgi:hypothetical protein
MTVRELGDKLDSKELSEWMCYFSVLQEKEEEQRKNQQEQKEHQKEQVMQGQITHGIMTAGAYKKANK